MIQNFLKTFHIQIFFFSILILALPAVGTAGLLYATVKFDPDADTPIPGGDGGDAGGPAPIIGGFYVHSLSDKWKLGANLITITGAVLDYDDDWAGRYLNSKDRVRLESRRWVHANPC